MSVPDSAKKRCLQLDLGGAAICVVLTAGVYLILVSPLLERRSAQASEGHQLEQQRQSATELAVKLRSLQDHLAQVEKQLADTPLRLQSPLSINRRLAQLTQLVGRCQFKLDQIEPGAPVAGARYAIVPIRLSGTGTYHAAANFAEALHKQYPDMGIRSFALSADRQDHSTSAQLAFDLNWYTAPHDTVTAEAASQ